MLAAENDEVSLPAFNEALQLAQAFGSALRLIHVADELLMDRLILTTHDPAWNALLVKPHYYFLLNMLQLAHQGGIQTDIQLIKLESKKQHIEFEIMAALKGWEANLLVIGSHSRPGAHHLELGSVAINLLRLSSVPVLCVPMHPQR